MTDLLISIVLPALAVLGVLAYIGRGAGKP